MFNFKLKHPVQAKIFSVLVLFFCLLFFSHKYSLASSVLFNEEFDTPAPSVWDYYEKAGSIHFESGLINLSSENTITFPFVAYKNNPFPIDGDFRIKIKIQYTRVTTKGSGFAVGTLLPPYHVNTDTPISSPIYSRYKFFQIWQDSINKLLLNYTGNCYNTSSCALENIAKYQSSQTDLGSHLIELKYQAGKYFIYLDSNLVYSSPATAVRPTRMWFGNNSLQGPGDPWTNFRIDYILVEKIDPPPLIFLPGMTACWNKALLTGAEADNWSLLAPARYFVYRNLLNSFNEAGLEQDEDWYLFCYDWRKPLSQNSQKLKEFIESEVDPSGEISLVGHSMGGLVARAYSQAYPETVNKLLTVGSPHEGAVQAYPAWEAGQIWEDEGIRKLFSKTLLWANKRAGEHPMETIRRAFPALQDILPTFDFLVDPDDNYKDINTHSQQNETMNDLNQSLTEVTKEKMGIFYGEDQETLETIKISSATSPSANWVHFVRGLWEDGEPIHECDHILCEYTDHKKDYSKAKIYSDQGDKTVLVKSATIEGVESYDFPLEHDELISKAAPIQQIHDFLGTGGTAPLPFLEKLRKALIFWIRSPAKITVSDPQGHQAGYGTSGPEIENAFYDDGADFLLIPNQVEGDYQIKIVGTGEGFYTLFLARLNEENEVVFSEYTFPTYSGKTDIFWLDSEHLGLKLKDPDGLLLLISAKTKLENSLAEVCQTKPMLGHFRQIEKLIARGKYDGAAHLIKVTLNLLNKCLGKLEGDDFFSSWLAYEAATAELSDLYVLYSGRAHFKEPAQKIENRLKLQEKFLRRQDKKLQERAEHDPGITLLETVLFETSVDLLQQAREAFEEDSLARAQILEFQLKSLLVRLART
jgi:pimeloyl-ACP methyl ester carboxylesterase